jgi:hypothetical protein
LSWRPTVSEASPARSAADATDQIRALYESANAR